MSRNGSGVYSLPAGNPVVTGTTISSSWANTTLSDIATALTGSVASDGQTAMTGNLQMGNNKVTGLAVATTSGDALSYAQAATVSDLAVTGNATVGGTLTLTGGLTLNGNVTVGDSSSDTLTVNATSTFAAGATFSSTFAANGGATLGDASGDALTINSSAVSIPNGLNFDSNTFVIDATNNRVGVNNATPTTALDVTGTATISTNLAFTGTGNRITGDFSNATQANRVYVQTSTSGGNTSFGLLPHPSNATPITTFESCLSSDAANTNTAQLQITTTDARINSGARGTASYLPLTMYTGGSERLRIDTSGNVGIGTSSPDGKLDIATGGSTDIVAALGGTFPAYTYRNGSGAWFHAGKHPSSDYFYIGNGGTPTTNISMVVDASGNVGIGTSSPSSRLDVSGSGTNASALIQATRSDLSITTAMGSDGGLSGGFVRTSTNHPLVFGTNNTERMRIDSSGNLLVGTTSRVNNERLSVKTTGAGVWPIIMLGEDRGAVFRITASSGYAAYFERNNGTYVGDIFLTSSGTTTYNTASDYRLKENIAPMTGALAKVAQLKPCTYTWKSDGSDGEGFIAHEIAQVVPQAVRGEKDAVDKDGKPVYQGIDTSFLVATLTAAIQEQQAIITDLKARIETLENK